MTTIQGLWQADLKRNPAIHISRSSGGRAFRGARRDAAVTGRFSMSRLSVFSSPLMLGFEQLEALLDQATKAGDSYPPYNIERMLGEPEGTEFWQISLAVAGFSTSDLELTLEGKHLVVKGRQKPEEQRDFLHRGIAGRSFQRSFVLADGMEVAEASLANGLLMILLKRQAPEPLVRRIAIKER
jgi:HSP20 family molecular chaperone IbpA